MEFEVGYYIRTKEDGYINKIAEVYDDCIYVVGRNLFGEKIIINKDEIFISSPNILDLVFVGDFIDGKRVVEVLHFADGFNRIELFGGKSIMNHTEIKSIVTKEQFESMEYKMGDKE